MAADADVPGPTLGHSHDANLGALDRDSGVLTAAWADLAQQFETIRSSVHAQLAELQRRQRALDETAAALEKRAAELQTLADELARRQAEVAALEQTLTAEQESLAGQQQQIAQQQETLAHETAAEAARRRELAEQEQRLRAQAAELEQEQAALAPLEAELTERLSQLEQREAALAARDRELAAREAVMRNFQTALAQITSAFCPTTADRNAAAALINDPAPAPGPPPGTALEPAAARPAPPHAAEESPTQDDTPVAPEHVGSHPVTSTDDPASDAAPAPGDPSAAAPESAPEPPAAAEPLIDESTLEPHERQRLHVLRRLTGGRVSDKRLLERIRLEQAEESGGTAPAGKSKRHWWSG